VETEMADRSTWRLIVHGGAGKPAPDRAAASRAGILAATAAGRAVLDSGGSALDAVEQAIRALEDDPAFNAGFGSVLNALGEVEMDAAIMDGSTLDFGGVAAVQGLRHPISVARALLTEPPILLAAEGARRFAEKIGAETCAPEAMIAPRRRPQPKAPPKTQHGVDTVGCVAIDVEGRIAAGTSTGGIAGKPPGRIGDSPLPGSGLYADPRGGVSLSGQGEKIARVLVAAEVMHALDGRTAQAAAEHGIARLASIGGDGGCIVLDRQGRFGCAHNSGQFAVGLAAPGLAQPLAFLHRSEMDAVLS
jgi:beta-aspartyl-peptidase (threonine type)